MPRSTPNYLTVDPTTGAIGAEFSGHIKATGVDLNAVETGNIANMVRWLAADGAQVGDIVALVSGPTSIMDIQSISPDGSREGYIEILQQNAGGNVASDYVRATLELGGVVKQATILQGDGGSDFLKLPQANRLVLIAARMGAGNPPNLAASVGVNSITRTGVGTFSINHAAVPSAYLMAVATCQGNIAAGSTANFTPIDQTHSNFQVTNAAGAAIDGEVVCLVGIGF